MRPVVATDEAAKGLAQLAQSWRMSSLCEKRLRRGQVAAQRRQFARCGPGPCLPRVARLGQYLQIGPVHGLLLGCASATTPRSPTLRVVGDAKVGPHELRESS